MKTTYNNSLYAVRSFVNDNQRARTEQKPPKQAQKL